MSKCCAVKWQIILLLLNYGLSLRVDIWQHILSWSCDLSCVHFFCRAWGHIFLEVTQFSFHLNGAFLLDSESSGLWPWWIAVKTVNVAMLWRKGGKQTNEQWSQCLWELMIKNRKGSESISWFRTSQQHIHGIFRHINTKRRHLSGLYQCIILF